MHLKYKWKFIFSSVIYRITTAHVTDIPYDTIKKNMEEIQNRYKVRCLIIPKIATY